LEAYGILSIPLAGRGGSRRGAHGGPMAEILTESFCERCGTRYTFQAAAPRRRGIGRIRTLTRGVKNFVANDNASFAEAMEAARDDEERTASAQQLDAFHETFNFCMGCRQYTCRNCWNSDAGECLSCAPDMSRDVLPPPFPRLAVVEAPEPDRPGRDPSAWPTSDLRPVLIPAVAESFPPTPVRHGRADPAELAETSPGMTNAAPATPGTDLELTPDELSAIQDALARHVGPPAEGPTAAPGSGTPLRVETASGLGRASPPPPSMRCHTPRRNPSLKPAPRPGGSWAVPPAPGAGDDDCLHRPGRDARCRGCRARGPRAGHNHPAGSCRTRARGSRHDRGAGGCRAGSRRARGCRAGGCRAGRCRARGTLASRQACSAARRSRGPAKLADGRARWCAARAADFDTVARDRRPPDRRFHPDRAVGGTSGRGPVGRGAGLGRVQSRPPGRTDFRCRPAGRRPVLCHVRPVALVERPLLPSLRDPPGLIRPAGPGRAARTLPGVRRPLAPALRIQPHARPRGPRPRPPRRGTPG